MAEEQAAPDDAIDRAPFRAPRPADLRLKHTRSVSLVIAFLVFVLDQAAKWVAVSPLQIESRAKIELADFFNLTFVQNNGVSLGLLSSNSGPVPWLLDHLTRCPNPSSLRVVADINAAIACREEVVRWSLVTLTAAIAIFVALWLWREKRRDDSVALALVLGGALGNICDRVRLGYVVDFLDLHFGSWHPFLVFNVGDAAITIGVLLLLVRALLMRDGRAKKKEA
jgi:signal peptidase II